MNLLNENVLVLNKHYLAVQVAIAKEAINALVKGSAQVVDHEYTTYDLDQWHKYTRNASEEIREIYLGMIRSPSTHLFIPHVVRFPDCEYTNPLIKSVKYSRKNIYSRDNYTCQYCREHFQKDLLTLDHVIPKSKGGKSNWTNIVTCCKSCNSSKGDKLLKDLGWELLKKPTSPRWESHTGSPFRKHKKRYWEPFLV